MRKYTGKFPHAVREVSSTLVEGVYLVKTNNGGAYYLTSKPRLGEDIFSYNFIRVQPMTFEQHASTFHRILDGYAIPFADYRQAPLPITPRLEELERAARRYFLHDMIKQGILPRFTA